MTVKERFWSKVNIKGPDDCWNWVASVSSNGYGAFSFNNRTVKASIMSWELHNSPLPKWTNHNDGICVLHKCDNMLCVNPKHLFLGTQKDNVKDRDSKNRQPNGENHGNSKLTKVEILEIRRRYTEGSITHQRLADEFKVSRSHITNIIIKNRWNIR